MTTADFLSRLCGLGVRLWITGDRLRCSAPEDVLTSALHTELAERKAEIIAFLREAKTIVFAEPPILPVPRDAELPLSFSQERLWFLDQLVPNSPFYNLSVAVQLKGWLDVVALERTLNKIVMRHEALRTTFGTVNGRPVQVIVPALTAEMPLVDLRALSSKVREAEARRLAREDALRPFDLERGPLLRVTLLRMEEQERVLLLTVHHIVSDGWSMGVLVREVMTLYEAFCKGRSSSLPELSIQYADYAVWQRSWLQGEVLEEQLAYWKKQLEGAPRELELPLDRPRPALQAHHGATLSFTLSERLTERLRELSRQEKSTLFMTLLAAFKVLLYHYTGQEDVVVGTRIAGRNRREIEELIGFFVNALVLRTGLSGEPTFRELLGRVRQVTLAAYAHQDLPFEMLVEELQPRRDLSRHPLFQVMFVLQNVAQSEFKLPGMTFTPLEIERRTSWFDLDFALLETEAGLKANLEYDTDLFDAERMTRLFSHYEALLEQVVADPERRLRDLPPLTEAERRQVLEEWNDTRADYPQETCLHELFAAQVERTPDSVAVVWEEGRVSYEALNRQANQLAHHLQRLGVGPEVPVGVCMERSPRVVVALLGILKAGGVYVPLDPGYPVSHLAYVMEDTGVVVVLTSETARQRIGEWASCALKPALVCLDTDWERIAAQPERSPVTTVTPGNLSHIVYTSGSTGKPKGVVVEQRQLLNRLMWRWRTHPFQSGEVMGQRTTMSFSVALAEMLEALLQGIAVVIIPDEVLQDAPRLVEVLEGQCVSRIVVVPSLLRMILEVEEDLQQSLVRLRLWSTCGEKLSVELYERFRQRLPRGLLLNQYGASEVNDVTCYDSREWQGGTNVPIGRPLNNSKVYLLDGRMMPVALGVPGEVYVSSVGLARGYLKRPELTAERFVPDPFGEQPGRRLYRMGDLARYRWDGNLEYVGRRDHQVKVRGIRVELGGIEALLREHPVVSQAVVVARAAERGEEDRRLVAYVVAQDNQKPTPGELRHHLKTRLPESVIPTAFVFLHTLPLTPNGKVDRKALPAPRQGVRPNAGKVAQILEQVKQLSEDKVRALLDELSAPEGPREG